MFQLDLKNGVPICDQIVNEFIKLRAIGVFKAEDRLPAVRALASKLCVNPNTVQKAYAILEANGVIYSVQGRGTFFSDDGNGIAAIIDNAKNQFKSAVVSAMRLGLTREDMISVINGEATQKEENNNDNG